jgi:hypothetical protein
MKGGGGKWKEIPLHITFIQPSESASMEIPDLIL